MRGPTTAGKHFRTSGTDKRGRPRSEESTNRRQGLRSSARLASPSPPNSFASSSSSSRHSSPSRPMDPMVPMDPSAPSSASSAQLPPRSSRPRHSSGPMASPDPSAPSAHSSGPMASPDSFNVMAALSDAVTKSVLHLLANQGRSDAAAPIRAALKDCQLAIRVTRAIVSSDQFKAGSPEPFAEFLLETIDPHVVEGLVATPYAPNDTDSAAAMASLLCSVTQDKRTEAPIPSLLLLDSTSFPVTVHWFPFGVDFAFVFFGSQACSSQRQRAPPDSSPLAYYRPSISVQSRSEPSCLSRSPSASSWFLRSASPASQASTAKAQKPPRHGCLH